LTYLLGESSPMRDKAYLHSCSEKGALEILKTPLYAKRRNAICERLLGRV
jgi:hypothetical protein